MKKPPRSISKMIKDAFRRRSGFARDQRGATLIEFALLGLPFFALIAAMLETALVFLASQVLDSAVQDGARLIRTGQTQIEDYTPDMFKDAMCSHLFGLFVCSDIKVKVSELVNFTSGDTTDDIIDPTTGDWLIEEGFDQGGGSSIVLVEAYYKWPTFMQGFGVDFANLPDNKRLLSAVRIFRNEPFS